MDPHLNIRLRRNYQNPMKESKDNAVKTFAKFPLAISACAMTLILLLLGYSRIFVPSYCKIHHKGRI